jgi:U32 family peptidase
MSAPSATPLPSPPPSRPARPELLAPAGDWDCVRAAVENGADAIYFGLERFNARMRAKNFTLADLPDLMAFLHRRGVRGYVTFNTLVFTDELDAAVEFLRAIIAAGVDAAIVQDVGICRLIRRLSPDFPIHTSTQMTITSAAGVAFARDLGAQLVVLARENSLAEIAAIQRAQAAAGATLPLEVFVHGALCVAYSGQCLTSESLGGRSANRGECAQACRLPYDLVADGTKVELGDRRYLLSPQDLSGLEVLPELVRAGVASLKIEGRLKSPAYVASITRVYREALDQVMAEATGETPPAFDRPAARYELEMSFSRGLYSGWFRGINNQELAHGRFGTKRGVYLGTITRVERERVWLDPVPGGDLKPGDGVVFDAVRPEAGEQGGRVHHLDPEGRLLRLGFGRGDLDFTHLRPGQKLWKTNDPALDRRVRATFAGDTTRYTRPVRAEVHGRAGGPLTLLLDDGEGHVARADSAVPLAPAAHHPLDDSLLCRQLGRLGGTPFHLAELHVALEGTLMLPVSELNRLRRDTAARLEELRAAPPRWTLQPLASAWTPPPAPPPPATPEIIAVIRELPQLDAAWIAGARTIYCEFENPKHYRTAVARFRELRAGAESSEVPHSSLDIGHSQSPAAPPPTIWVSPPRIFKPGEEWILEQVRSAGADGYLVRNHDHLTAFAGARRRGDFSLNVANPLTAAHYRERHGLERVTASYDLNLAQLESLLQAAPGGWFDITLHQHMPMFHMEHCVFCAFLSTGKDYRDCGRPCDQHRVALRDRVGAELPLKADAGCRNTVYNNRAQTGAEYVDRLLALGARSFRVEFVNESPAEVTHTLDRYQRLLRGELAGADLWRELKLINQLGVTRGQLEATPQVLLKKR